jgi:hypothetical protein
VPQRHRPAHPVVVRWNGTTCGRAWKGGLSGFQCRGPGDLLEVLCARDLIH